MSSIWKQWKDLKRWQRMAVSGAGIGTFGLAVQKYKAYVARQVVVPDDTILHWRINEGGIQDISPSKGNIFALGPSIFRQEQVPIIALADVIRTLRYIERDDRVTGIFADFSSYASQPANATTGLAQIEEVCNALERLDKVKRGKMGDKWKTVAWADSFSSQKMFTLACAFQQVYAQPMGSLPLVGVSSFIPMFHKMLDFLGIHFSSQARDEYKSMVAPLTQDALSDPQRRNLEEVAADVNDLMLQSITKTRKGKLRVNLKDIIKKGPFSPEEAVELGLIDGLCYMDDVVQSFMSNLDTETNKVAQRLKIKAPSDWKTRANESRFIKMETYDAAVDRNEQSLNHGNLLDIACIHVTGTIGSAGEFGTKAILKSLRDAADDDSIKAIILRVNTGGGSATDGDTLWHAVTKAKEKKPVIASFGNAAASAGYLLACPSNHIFADRATITGSIGVAALLPAFTPRFFETFKLGLDSVVTGSRMTSDITYKPEGETLDRWSKQVDALYDIFLARVADSRKISPAALKDLAGGRVILGARAAELLKKPTASSPETDGTSSPLDKEYSERPLVGAFAKAIQSKNDALQKKAPTLVDETSPFSPVNEVGQLAEGGQLAEAGQPGEGGQLAQDHVKSSEKDSTPSYTIGRGLVDSVGGVHDAAAFAAELYTVQFLAAYNRDNPGASQIAAMRAMLPSGNLKVANDGSVEADLQVRLITYPKPLSILEQLKKANENRSFASALASYAHMQAMHWLGGLFSSLVDDAAIEQRKATQVKTTSETPSFRIE